MRIRLPLALLVAASVMALASPALAVDSISVAVIPTETPNVDHAAFGKKLRQRIETAITEAPEFVAVTGVEMSPELARSFFSCFDEAAECMAQMADSVTARRAVWARVERKEGAWFLRVRMLDFESRAYIIDKSFTLPGGAERQEELELLASGLIRGQTVEVAPTSRLVVDSDPPGADISVDGQLMGTTPLTQHVTRGRHLVELALPGRRVVRKEIDVGPGEHRELIRLPIKRKQVTAEVGPVETASDWPLWAGIGAGAVAGIAATVATVAWVDSQGVADEAATMGAGTPAYLSRKDEYESLETLHLASTLTATVAGAAAVYFLVFHEDTAAPTVTPTVSEDGAGAMIMGRF